MVREGEPIQSNKTNFVKKACVFLALRRKGIPAQPKRTDNSQGLTKQEHGYTSNSNARHGNCMAHQNKVNVDRKRTCYKFYNVQQREKKNELEI